MKFWEKHDRSFRLLSVLDTMRSNPLTCDFEIKFSNRIFSAHRLVLMASSEYFRSLLLGGHTQEAKQGFVILEDLVEASVENCLEYIYTGKLNITHENIKEILETSNYLQMDEVKDLCFKFLQVSLSASNCFEILGHAVTYQSENTVDVTVRFIEANFTKIIKTAPYQQTEVDIIVEILRTCQEYTTRILWWGIKNWILYHPENRKSYLTVLIKEINHYELKYTLDVIINDPLVVRDDEATKYVASVIFRQWEGLRRYLNQTNCFKTYQWTTRYNCNIQSELFRSVLLDFMITNFIATSQIRGFKSLSITDLYSILDSAMTRQICQTVRWQAIVNWINAKPSATSHFEKLLALLDFKKLPPEYIQKNISTYPLVQNSHECKNMILEAAFFHATRKDARINSCLILDKTCGELHCHFDDAWRKITTDSRLIGGSLLASRGEVFAFNWPSLYQIQSNGNVETKQPCPGAETVRAVVVHAGRVFVFYENLRLWVYEISIAEWRFSLYGFDEIPTDTSACSTAKGVLFLGGGCDGKYRKLYDPDHSKDICIPSMKYKRRNPTSASIGSIVFLVGGIVDKLVISYTDSTEIYSVKSNSWSTLTQRRFADYTLFLTAQTSLSCCEADNGIYLASSYGFDRYNFAKKTLKQPQSQKLWIEVISNWSSTVINDSPRVHSLQMAGWICHGLT